MAKIIFWEDFLKRRKRWTVGFISIVGVFLIIVGGLVARNYNLASKLIERENIVMSNIDFYIKEEILKILRPKGISVGQGLDIANAVVNKSKEKDIPVGKVLGIMKKESEFNIHAKSSAGATGLMQILPSTWDIYVKKLKLDVSRQAMTDPYVNIMVALEILADLRDLYKSKDVPDSKLWDYVLAAYFAGTKSANNGITGEKRKYVEAVNKRSDSYKYIDRGKM